MQDESFIIPEEMTFGGLFQTVSNSVAPNQTEKQIILLHGFPFDEGTQRNGGRVGGEKGSAVFRQSLQSIQIYPENQMKDALEFYDFGDLQQFSEKDEGAEITLEQAHLLQQQKVLQLLTNNAESYPILIGGSNDQSYPNVSALMDAFGKQRIGVINLDAHFDVRPLKEGKAHSGSPFRLMIENEQFKENKGIFVQFACQGASTSQDHFQYLQQNSCQVYWMQRDIRRYNVKENLFVSDKDPTQKETLIPIRTQAGQLMNDILNKMEKEVDRIFFSFDIDSINSSFCPGVSAPSVVGGLTSDESFELCLLAGMNSKVKLIDFSEFNPAVEAERTSGLIVHMVYHYIKGLSLRAN